MNGQRLTVLHVMWSGGSGGAEKYLLDIVRHSDPSRFEHCVCFLGGGGAVADAIRACGARVHTVGMKNGRDLPAAWRFLRWLCREKADVIHNHCRNFLATLILLSVNKRPCVYSEHGGWLLAPSAHYGHVFYRLLASHHDLILANSELLRRKILSMVSGLASRIEVLHIGIDPAVYQNGATLGLRDRLGIPKGNKIVGIVGRLVEAKGIDDFIRVAAKISAGGSGGISYVVIGDGPLRRELESLARELSVAIAFLGDRNDVPALLSVIDVYLFTSKWESFGIVLLEAMASGVPVVGFNTGGAVEIMSRGGAVIVEDRDLGKAALEVTALLSDPAKSGGLGKAGRDNVERNFNVVTSTLQLQAVYGRLAGAAGEA